jgi:hypothetical protein
MTALETALQYAGRGWRVIPCRSDKISRIRNWPVAASCDPEMIISWWTQWPNAWIALLCGCGFVVIDVDTGEAHNNVDGFGTLAQLGPPRRCAYAPHQAGCTYTSKLINRFALACLAPASNFALQINTSSHRQVLGTW